MPSAQGIVQGEVAFSRDRVAQDSADSTDRDGTDRRVRQRLSLLRPVQYVYRGQLQIGEMEDISEDGMRVRITRPIPPNEMVKLYVTLPPSHGSVGKRCRIDGRVIWQAGDVVGLSFTDFPAENWQHVQELVEHTMSARQPIALGPP